MHYIGFDIGGTKCAISLGKWEKCELTILKRVETLTLFNPQETIEVLATAVYEWIDKYDVKGAGISCGGPLNAQKGIIIAPPNLGKEWHGFEIVAYIKQKFGLNAKMENDANASAVAEWKFGAGKGTKNLVFMTFGTGLGAGLILDGRLYSGTNGNAGEIGHVRIEDDGPIGYNKTGSAEGFCSGNGIRELAQIFAKKQGLNIPVDITTKQIFERAKAGEEFYLSVIKESAKKFAKVVSILIDLFNPEVIVVGGVFMRNYEFFMSEITPIVQRESLSDSFKVCKILPAKIGENIGDYAALSIAILGEDKK